MLSRRGRGNDRPALDLNVARGVSLRGMRTTDTDTDTTAADLAAIHAVVATIQHAQQTEDVDEFVSLFRPDAIWTTAAGRRLFGREAIAAFTARALPGAMAASTATYTVEHVLFIRPDVAAVKVRQQPVTLAGDPIPGEHDGSPLYVMAKEDGRWLLTACQNTAVTDG